MTQPAPLTQPTPGYFVCNARGCHADAEYVRPAEDGHGTVKECSRHAVCGVGGGRL